MRDAIGNRIHEGSLLWMQHWGVVARVSKLHEGGLSVVGADRNERSVTPPVLTLEIDMPLDARQITPGVEPQLQGILCIIDPRAERVVDGMLRQ